MNKSKYLYRYEPLLKLHEFTREGPKGSIEKVVQLTYTGTENVYNLAFGDYDEKTKSMNDLSVTNSGDGFKVLATVASTVYSFIEKYPNAWIVATGSTNVRNKTLQNGNNK